jgi:predicted metallo-beta-lactamase superfamily hydrolase
MEHHILRDEKWREACLPIFDTASKSSHRVLTAAEFLGTENCLLEYRRKELHETEPPDSDFRKWMKLLPSKRRAIKPPI